MGQNIRMIESHQLHAPHGSTPTPPATHASLPKQKPYPQHQLPRRHHRIRWTILSITFVAVVLLGTASWVTYRAISVINTKRLDGSKLSFFQQLTHIVTSGGDQIQGEAEDRVNILLLGYGGPGHDGPYLTDTMMVVSVQPSTKKVALLSIPRDLVVDIPGYDYRKINNVLSFGRDDDYPGGGEALAVKVVSDTLNIPIQYYARLDFDGFVDVINQVGGVTVTVDTAFSDYMYPDNNYGYEPVSFKTGTQNMDGERALKFARSRHGNNGEGGDFARAARQQKIIVALKDKLLSLGTLTNPKKISDILESIGSHSQTNMEIWEMLRLAKIAGNVQGDQIINKVFDDSTDGLLKSATGSGGAFILVPRSGNYEDMQFLARNIFLDGAADDEGAKILVVNATGYTNLANTTKQTLQALGLSVPKAMSLAGTSIGQTVLVSIRPGQYPATEKLLSLYAHAAGAIDLANWTGQTGDTTLAESLATPIITNTNHAVNTNATASITPDLVLVLGQDQPKPSETKAAGTVTSTNTNTATNTNTKSTINTNSATNTSAVGGSASGGNTNATNTNSTISNTNTKAVNANTAVTNASLNKNTNSASR